MAGSYGKCIFSFLKLARLSLYPKLCVQVLLAPQPHQYLVWVYRLNFNLNHCK